MKKAFTLFVLSVLALGLNAQSLKTITWDGQQRQYLEYVPSTYSDAEPAPVLFMLHGLGDQINNFFQATEIQTVAEQKGWIVVCPQALDFNVEIAGLGSNNFGTAWNAGISFTITFNLYGMSFDYPIAVNQDVDDEGFLMATLEALDEEYNLNSDSLFFAGFSLGGFMCHRMAIEHGDIINSIAAVSGVIGTDMTEFTPVDNVNVLQIFGTSDEMITYDSAMIALQSFGSAVIGMPVEETVEYWRAFNQCDENPIIEQYPDTYNDGLSFEMYSYPNGNNDSRVSFLKVNNGMHTWYSGANHDIDYNTEIVKFFTNTLDVTGVDESSNEALGIWPNPVAETLNLNAKDLQQVDIFSIDGRQVMSLNNGFESINVSQLTQGTYLLKGTYNNGNTAIQKFVKL